MNACVPDACTWVGVAGQQGWSRGLQSGVNEGLVLGHACKGLVLQARAQGILADDRLGSGSEEEMGWLPWNLQRVPTLAKVRTVL